MVPNPTDGFILGDERVDSFMQNALSRVERAFYFLKEKQNQCPILLCLHPV
jgi:hypothetical protein